MIIFIIIRNGIDTLITKSFIMPILYKRIKFINIMTQYIMPFVLVSIFDIYINIGKAIFTSSK